jgi:hypothetical protein
LVRPAGTSCFWACFTCHHISEEPCFLVSNQRILHEDSPLLFWRFCQKQICTLSLTHSLRSFESTGFTEKIIFLFPKKDSVPSVGPVRDRIVLLSFFHKTFDRQYRFGWLLIKHVWKAVKWSKVVKIADVPRLWLFVLQIQLVVSHWGKGA